MKLHITILAIVIVLCCFGLPCLAVCPTMDSTGDCQVNFADFAVFADQWLTAGMPDMTWVSINEPGFTGYMSKYETTNAQYCHYLNEAKASNQIVVYDNKVYATSDTSHSQLYYNLAGVGYTYNGATLGGAARINYTGSSFAVDSGFENHPVTYVSWYGATAFCNYYGYRLPTELEWQAVADFNGSYTYGCGTTITNAMANCYDSAHLDGTTTVGAFGAYGYGVCDMAGNVWEWTNTADGFNRVGRGGCWGNYGSDCTVSSLLSREPNVATVFIGFRVCASAVCSSMDFTGDCRVDFKDFALFAKQWLDKGIPDPDGMVWIHINDSGVSGHERFDGYMSKYETTNAQYCQYLNAALASNQITVYAAAVYATSDTDHRRPYYDLTGPGYPFNGATNGGAARIQYWQDYSGGRFIVENGFENHPVTYVTWYGAATFCEFYGYLLPTEWEWQAVADYDGSYMYGCGTAINNSKANYYDSNHPYGTTVVGTFGAFGYGLCDMAGNVWEWTRSTYKVGSSYAGTQCGGGWTSFDYENKVVYRMSDYVEGSIYCTGFRACR